MANANIMPPDAEKLLFAIDVVKFVLNKNFPLLSFDLSKIDVTKVVEDYRPHVRTHFDENVKKVVEEIDETQKVIVRRDFSEIENKEQLTAESLMQYNKSFKDCNLSKEFSAGNFLVFCARVSLMSCFFFSKGSKDALDLAVELIKTSFPIEDDECRLIWDDMENAALKYNSDSSANESELLFRREPAEVISSETEESSNSSSTTTTTTTTESESASEIQNMTSASSTESLNTLIMKLNFAKDKRQKAAVAVLSMESSRHVENESMEAAETAAAAENTKSENIQSPPVSKSTFQFPKADIDFKARIEKAFADIETEPPSRSTSVTSPKLSYLGKRPSPRKANPLSLRGQALDDTETEIKKPKLESPEKKDENE